MRAIQAIDVIDSRFPDGWPLQSIHGSNIIAVREDQGKEGSRGGGLSAG